MRAAALARAVDAADRVPPRSPPSAGAKMVADPGQFAVPGIRAASPFGRKLAAALASLADIRTDGREPVGSYLWRLTVRGTALDGFGGGGGADQADPARPDHLLDLHGEAAAGTIRRWRVVDGAGNPVMRPFGCFATPGGVASLYLLETCAGAAEGVVLAEAHVSTRQRYRAVLDALGRAAVWLVASALQAPVPQPAPGKFPPHQPAVLWFIGDRLAHLAAWLRDHAGSEIWAIGRIAAPPQSFLNSRTVLPENWLEVPMRDGFIADPFAWPGHPRAIVYESYAHRTGRGTLAAFLPDAGADGASRQLDLPIDSHISYPFVYAEGDTVYLLPEMTAERCQALYVLLPDGSLREHCFIADHVAMADPSLFRHGGYYWIAYNDLSLGANDNLCLRYAERLEGPWTAHRLNPVKIDVRSSRPGGTPFRVGETLFRPAQDCSRGYGCAVAINRVVSCTPEHYRELAVARLTPDPSSRFPHGTHTFSVTEDGILLDGKRVVFSPGILLRRMQRRIRATIRPRELSLPHRAVAAGEKS